MYNITVLVRNNIQRKKQLRWLVCVIRKV